MRADTFARPSLRFASPECRRSQPQTGASGDAATSERVISSNWKNDGPPPPILPHLRDAFGAAREGHQRSLDALRDAVCAYVDELRHRGADAEDVERAVREQFDAMEADGPDEAAQWRTDLIDAILESCE